MENSVMVPQNLNIELPFSSVQFSRSVMPDSELRKGTQTNMNVVFQYECSQRHYVQCRSNASVHWRMNKQSASVHWWMNKPNKNKCMLSRFSHVWFFATLWTVAYQASLSMGILQAIIQEWVAISFSRGSSWLRDGTWVSYVSCTGRWVLHHQHHLGSPRT